MVEEVLTQSMSTKDIEKHLKERKKEEKEQIKEQERINKIQKNNPSWMWNLVKNLEHSDMMNTWINEPTWIKKVRWSSLTMTSY